MAATLDDTNAAGVAAEVQAERDAEDGAPAPRRGRGRPKGSKTRNRTRPRSNERTDEDAPKAEREPYKATPESIASSTLLAATFWTLAGPMLKLSQLTDSEAEQLGKAVDPILHKYVPMLDNWREEINLTVALVGAYQVTRSRYRAEHPEEFVRRVYEPTDAELRGMYGENGADPNRVESTATVEPKP